MHIQSYLAGFFDGEGCVSIYPTKCKSGAKYRAEIQINNLDNIPLLMFKDRYGGNIYFHKRSQKNIKWRDIYNWNLSDKGVKYFLEDLLPYLITKKEQAKLVLEFFSLPKISNVVNVKQMPLETKRKYLLINKQTVKRRGEIYERIKQNKALVPV